MKRKWAVYGYINDWIGDFDLDADTKEHALALAKLETPYASKVELVKPGNDLGVDSP